jgi:hypothetical protein
VRHVVSDPAYCRTEGKAPGDLIIIYPELISFTMTPPSENKRKPHGMLRSALSIVLCATVCIAVYPATDENPLESADRYFNEKKYNAAINIWLNHLSKNPKDIAVKQKLEAAYVKQQGEDLEYNRGMLNTPKDPVPEKKTNPPVRGDALRIVIFNFTATGEPEKHEHYEYIIPQTIAKNLSATGGYNIRRIQEKFTFAEGAVNAVEQIKSAGPAYSADYIISGNVNVAAKRLDIDVRIHNTRKGTAAAVQNSSQETGVLLKDTIDQLSAGIIQQFTTQRPQRESDTTGSTFLRFYRSLEGLTFGFQGGYAFIKRPWRQFRSLNDNFYYGTFLQYRFIPHLGISMNLDYFSTNNIGNCRINSLFMTQWIPTIELKLFLPLSRYFRFSMAIGGGAAFTRIVYRPYSGSDPFVKAEGNRSSTDPHLSSSVCFDVTAGPVLFSLGTSYRHTFIYGKQIQWITVFTSLGYSF